MSPKARVANEIDRHLRIGAHYRRCDVHLGQHWHTICAKSAGWVIVEAQCGWRHIYPASENVYPVKR